MGYGMSYDAYSYSNLQVNKSAADANDTLTVSADVTNNGTTTGQTVPQLYVTTPFEPASAQAPAKRLEAFQKVSLDAGQTKTVTFSVPVSKLAFYDTPSNSYIVDPGSYGLQVSSSAADSDVELSSTVSISGTIAETPTTLTAKPIQTGDAANNIAQRVMFDVNKTITPQLTVAMADQKLYGYITKGQSTELPAGAVVTYSSDRPAVVAVGTDQSLTTGNPGVATVTATLTYNGGSAKTSFVVDVGPLTIVSTSSTTFQQGTAGTFTVSTTGSPTPTLTETGALPAGITFVDNGDGTATLAGTTNDPIGAYPITITAHNGLAVDATQSFTFNIGSPTPCVSNAQVLSDGDFEAATLAPWSGFGGGTVALTTADHVSGQQSVVTTKRTGPYQGPSQSVANAVSAGATYTVSAKVKYTTGPATHTFGVTMTDGSNYGNMVTATVTQGQWTTISGTYTVPASGMDVTKARIYVETPTTAGASTDLMDFWTDDVSMVGLTTSPAFNGGILTNGGFETGSVNPWTGNDTAKLALSRTDAADGGCSVAVTGRTKTDSGPAQDVSNKLVAGTTYAVSAKVKYTTGPATKTFDFAVQDDASKGAVMASGVATLGQWSTISGTYTVPSGKYDLTADHVVVETPYTATPAADDLLDFSADDLSIVALAGPVITSVSVADGDSVKGTTTFQVNLGGAASDVSYTYIELNQNGAWITDNTTDSAKALGSTNSGLSPKLVVDTTTLANGTYGLKIDAVGTNGATTEKKISFTINNPMAIPTLTSAAAPFNGWYTTAVSVALVSSVAGDKIQYQVDGDGSGWKNYSKAFSISADGVHTVQTRLLSNSVVVDTSDRTFTVKVDKTKPTASAAFNPTTRGGSPRNPVTVVFTATDATSGVATIEYNLNGGAWTATTAGSPVTLDTPGTFVVGYRATDKAGNVSTTKSSTVTIKADPDTTAKVSPSKAAAGAYVTVSLAGFHRYTMVDVTLGSVDLGGVTTDVNGAAKVTVRIPAATAAGTYTVDAQ